MAGGCPGVLVLHAVGPAPIPFSQVLVALVVGDQSFLLELVSNASGVGLVGEPRLDDLDSSVKVGVADGGSVKVSSLTISSRGMEAPACQIGG